MVINSSSHLSGLLFYIKITCTNPSYCKYITDPICLSYPNSYCLQLEDYLPSYTDCLSSVLYQWPNTCRLCPTCSVSLIPQKESTMERDGLPTKAQWVISPSAWAMNGQLMPCQPISPMYLSTNTQAWHCLCHQLFTCHCFRTHLCTLSLQSAPECVWIQLLPWIFILQLSTRAGCFTFALWSPFCFHTSAFYNAHT